MPGQKPQIVEIYRIVHIDNVEYLLSHGMFTRQHAQADPSYINIGDANLIMQRTDYPVPIDPPNGQLGDYLPFYFGPLSPMLLNIKTGYRGITQRPQSDIVYIICEVDTVVNTCPAYCFTDGHAKANITEFYNDLSELDNVHWDIVRERYWRNTERDRDTMRKKEAEFLVRDNVPTSCISSIVVYDELAKQRVEQFVTQANLTIPVSVKRDYYYY